jgi:riboflavin kinase/FMN adenylyltransferase
MEIFAGSAQYCSALSPIVTIGNFDGVHLGHQTLLSSLKAEAKKRSAPSCVFTFEPSPRSLLSPNRVPRIAPWTQKIKLLREFGIDQVVLERFSIPFAQHPANWFVSEIIQRRLRTQAMVVGYDFRFGRARSGTVDTLKNLAPDIDIMQMSALSEHDLVVSSSEIRKKVAEGKIEVAASLLGRPYSLQGVVISGEKRGRKLGFPTANIQSDYDLIPETGVYAVRVSIDHGDWKDGIANLGYNPTFQGQKFKIEVHLFEFSSDIYGSDIEVQFINRIRSERCFPSAEELVHQLSLDIQKAKSLLAL